METLTMTYNEVQTLEENMLSIAYDPNAYEGGPLE